MTNKFSLAEHLRQKFGMTGPYVSTGNGLNNSIHEFDDPMM